MFKWIPRKICAIICMLVLSCVCVLPIKPAVSAGIAKSIFIVINDQVVDFAPNEQGPMMISDRTYVPLRVISENLGAKVEWKQDTWQVLINRVDSASSLTIPASNSEDVQIIIDGQLLTIPNDYGKAFISQLGRTMIPIRAVGEALGCVVNWDSGTVNIKSQVSPSPIPEPELPQPIPETTEPVDNSDIQPPVNMADNQLLKDLAQYKTNLKLKDGSVINSEILLTKDPAAFSSEQLAVFKTYLGNLSKYQPSIIMPGGEPMNTADISILGDAYLTAEQLKCWIMNEIPRINDKMISQGRQFNAIPELADLYIKIGAEYGVRGDLAFCQAAKETGYWQFTGSVQPGQNNYCGLWATGNPLSGQESLNGADSSQVHFEAGTHGATFVSPEAGVEAHIQHLYAYATKNPLPVAKLLLDPRFILVNKGSAPNWQGLNARWAVPGIDYGQSIINDYWLKAVNTK